MACAIGVRSEEMSLMQTFVLLRKKYIFGTKLKIEFSILTVFMPPLYPECPCLMPE